VSELAELLELLHGADAPFETLYGRFRTWRHHERGRVAFEAWAKKERRRGASVGSFGRGDAPEESEEFVSIWRQEPDLARTERPGSYAVAVGERWWVWRDDSGAMSNEEDDSVSSGVGAEMGPFLSPARLLGLLRFEPAGRAERVGRQVILADGWPRPMPRHMPHSFVLHELGLGAERYRLELDAERGLVLAAQAFIDGAPFTEVKALELTVDEPLDPALFEFAPPEGEEVRSPLDLRHVKSNVSIAEAQAAAPFTLMIPERVPESWHLRCSYVAERERPRTRPSVHLHYHSDSAHESLSISQGYASELGPEIDEEQFEKAQAGDRPVWIRKRDDTWPQAQLLMEHADTRIQMTSDSLSAEQLIALAAMLVPAPDTPSDL